jgi:N-acetylglucosamine kinase-like BadF-type ATPase
MDLVLGIDAGGTCSRAALHTLDGTLLGRGLAGGGNPGTLGVEHASANLANAVVQALGSVDPTLVRAGVAGLAGNSALAAATVARALAHSGVTAPAVVTVGDVVTAFAAGTPEPSGAVLISGTGAIAAKITDHEQAAIADGYGWLLGDEGSAFWLGHAAARTTIRALAQAAHPDRGPALWLGHNAAHPAHPDDGGVAVPRLAALVVRHLVPEGLGGDPVAQVVAAVHARPPLALAELAPLVSRAAADGDPAAAAIVAEAAKRLVATVSEVHEPGLPIVLSGSVLTSEGPVRQAVQDLLGDAMTAGDTAGAAAWLAARRILGPQEATVLHRPFVTPTS